MLVAEVTPTDETKHGIENKVNELSSPSIMIRGNKKAVIDVNDVGEAEPSPISGCAEARPRSSSPSSRLPRSCRHRSSHCPGCPHPARSVSGYKGC